MESTAKRGVRFHIGTLIVVLAVAWLWPEIRKYGRLDGAADGTAEDNESPP